MNENDLADPIAAAIAPKSSVASFARENVEKLSSLATLLGALSDEAYASQNDAVSASSPGAHVRHVLDFYESVLRGAVNGTIDYEHRERNPVIEVDRTVAIERIGALTPRLLALANDRSLEVVVVDLDGNEQRSRSSLLRELDAALGHSVHHFAIIAILLRLRGIEPPPELGLAPSTLRYLKTQSPRR